MSHAQHDRVWIRVTVECPPPATEAVSASLLNICPGGLSVEDAGDVTRVTGYLPPTAAGCDAALARLRDALRNIPAELAPKPPSVTTQSVPERDWVEAFRRHCRPVRVGRIVVKPTWHSWPDAALPSRPDDIVIELDPGMAFGTGDHPTTRACLAALAHLLRPGDRVVDFGCGSGILSIAAVRLGAAEVAAVDSDRAAVGAALDNIALANAGDHIRLACSDTLSVLSPGWDLIVANIAPAVVTAEAPAAYRLLRPGGAYVCSGIPLAGQPEVEAALSAAGFAALRAESLEGWACLSARRPSGEGVPW